MADMDSNPFADPEDSPFGGSSSRSAGNTQTAGLDDYNPFAQQATATKAPPPPVAAPVQDPRSSASQSAMIQPTNDAPPPYQPAAAQQVDTAELKQRQEELERKAAELQEREQKLRDRTVNGAKDNNFPPLPERCCVKPCFYQDFDLDIPPEFSRIVKIAYYTWIARSVQYALNFIFSIGYIAVAKGTLSAGSTLGLSILWVILFMPCSFVCWYRPVYKAFRSDSSINFFVFFFNSAAQIIVDIVFILGPSGSGFLGLLTAIPMLNGVSTNEVNMGGVMFIVVIISVPMTIIDVALLIRVHALYRGTGASFQKAQTEFASGVLTNEGVRDAGAQIAANAATGAMNSAASGNKY